MISGLGLEEEITPTTLALLDPYLEASLTDAAERMFELAITRFLDGMASQVASG